MQIGPQSHYWKTRLYDNCMITVQNSNSHFASHTVAQLLLKLPVCMTQCFCSYGMEEILGLRSEFGR